MVSTSTGGKAATPAPPVDPSPDDPSENRDPEISLRDLAPRHRGLQGVRAHASLPLPQALRGLVHLPV